MRARRQKRRAGRTRSHRLHHKDRAAAVTRARAHNLERGHRDLHIEYRGAYPVTNGLAGGVAYAVRASVTALPAFSTSHDIDATAGDAAIQTAIHDAGYRCLTLCPSWCQHLGASSIAHTGRRLRYVRELAGPLTV